MSRSMYRMDFAPSVIAGVIELVHAYRVHRTDLEDALAFWPASDLTDAAQGEAMGHAARAVASLDEAMATAEGFLRYPLPERAEVVRTILAIGVALLDEGELHPALIIAPLVGQTEERGLGKFKGVVNAILRTYSNQLTKERQAYAPAPA